LTRYYVPQLQHSLYLVKGQLAIPWPVPLILCTDSRPLYDCLAKLGTTNEKKLRIDIMSLRQSYEKREIAEVRWIDGRDNPADAIEHLAEP
jgi:hypothetical protein